MRKRIPISKICEVYDGPHATPKKIDKGPVYLGIDAITDDGKIDSKGYSYLSEEDYIKWTKRVTPKYGDIVFSYEATLGRYALIPKGFYGCLGRRLAVIRNVSSEINTKWLFYYLRSPEWTQFIESKIIKGSTVNRISIEDFPAYTVPCISLEKQNAIVHILSRLDEKIELNKEINDNLEQQLTTLYDYWFTQFDFPDENGKPYQSSGGKMVMNNGLKKKIPDGWNVESVFSNQLSSIIKPGVDEFDTKTYFATADVKGTSISSGTLIDYKNRENRANMQPSVNSVWFAKMKNSIKHLYLNEEMLPIISTSILSTGFCGLQCSDVSFEYMASYISNTYFETHKDMLAHGATQEAVNNDDLTGIHIVIPNDKTLQNYHRITQPIYSQISKNICENQELVKLRDWLLPMLMNGQATIAD